jgi:hypothetical protein
MKRSSKFSDSHSPREKEIISPVNKIVQSSFTNRLLQQAKKSKAKLSIVSPFIE